MEGRQVDFVSSKKMTNNKGMGLVEIILSMGLLGILSLAFTNMISQSNKSTRELEEKVNLLQFEKDLITVTAGLNLCEKEFATNPATYRYAVGSFPPASNINIPALYLDPAGTLSFAVADTKLNPNGRIKIDQIRIRNIRGTFPNLLADLDVLFKEGLVSRKPVTSLISIAAVNDGSNVTLTGCQVRNGGAPPGGPVDSQTVCENLGGVWVDPGSPRPPFCSFDSDTMSWF